MTEADAGAAAATPPNDAAPNNPTTEAKAPSPGPSSFQDYVKTLPEDLQAHAAKKGWKDYGDAIKAHAAAESLIGNKIDAPKPGDADALKAHMVKIGAIPPDGNYALQYDADLAEGVTVDEGMKSAFEAFLKENPVPQSAAQNLVKMWNGMAAEARKAQEGAAEAEVAAKDAALESLRKEWGPEQFEAQMTLATKAAAFGAQGMDEGVVDALLNVMESRIPGGTKAFVQFFANIGALGTEDQFGQGTGGQPPASAKSLADRLYDKTPSP